LSTLDPALVSSVDYGTKDLQSFFEQNQALYLELTQLAELHDRFVDEYEAKVQRAAGLDLDLGADDSNDGAFGALGRRSTRRPRKRGRATRRGRLLHW